MFWHYNNWPIQDQGYKIFRASLENGLIPGYILKLLEYQPLGTPETHPPFFRIPGGLGLHSVQEEAGALEQDGPVDDRIDEPGDGHSSGPTGTVRQAAEAGEGAFGGGEGEPAPSTFRQRAEEAVLRAGVDAALLRTLQASLQRRRPAVLPGRDRGSHEDAPAPSS